MRAPRIYLNEPVVIGLFLIGLFSLILLALPHIVEPRYKGKPLSYWIETGRASGPERIAAIRSMKEQAVPLLIKRLSVEPFPRPRFVWERAPRVAKLFRLPAAGYFEEVRISAADLLGELGSDALPAAPQLKAVWKSAYQPWCTEVCRAHARAALFKIRGESVESFIAPLTVNATTEAWQDYGLVLAILGTNAAVAVPLLMDALKTNQNRRVKNSAVIALGHIHSQPALCIETLTEAASSSDPMIRENAISALGQFGKDAKPAWSTLVELRNRPEQMTSYRASVSLWQIDPESAKKLGINYENHAHPRL